MYNKYEHIRREIVMEFLTVSTSKLKIMLTRTDMEKYDIDREDVDYDNPKIRRSFWRIIDKAREACGFEVAGDKLLVQFYPCKDGCEIFVTKLGLISSGIERTISKSSKVAMLAIRKSVYKFEEREHVKSALALLRHDGYENNPEIYADEKGSYYVIIEERKSLSDNKDCMSVLTEYGTAVPDNLAKYIEEHSEKIDI